MQSVTVSKREYPIDRLSRVGYRAKLASSGIGSHTTPHGEVGTTMAHDVTTADARPTVGMLWLGGAVSAGWVILITLTVMLFADQTRTYTSTPLLRLATHVLIGATVVAAVVIGCKWLDLRRDAAPAKVDALRAQLARVERTVADIGTCVAALARHTASRNGGDDLTHFLSESAEAYELGRRAGLAERGEDGPEPARG